MAAPPVTIGVLALQGAFIEHIRAFSALDGVVCREVRSPAELQVRAEDDVAG